MPTYINGIQLNKKQYDGSTAQRTGRYQVQKATSEFYS